MADHQPVISVATACKDMVPCVLATRSNVVDRENSPQGRARGGAAGPSRSTPCGTPSSVLYCDPGVNNLDRRPGRAREADDNAQLLRASLHERCRLHIEAMERVRRKAQPSSAR